MKLSLECQLNELFLTKSFTPILFLVSVKKTLKGVTPISMNHINVSLNLGSLTSSIFTIFS